ncbi:MAG: hypothetical protein AAF432_00175 [Planctomycetota bacterium]
MLHATDIDRRISAHQATVLCAGMMIAACLINACTSEPDRPAIEPVAVVPTRSGHAPPIQPIAYPGLDNVVQFADGIYSGSAPDAPAGFDSIRALGVQTIISVDGAVPDVAAAQHVDLRYIHLPMGYDGIPRELSHRLARAARDNLQRGPIYVHCHHGRHRSASAAGTIAVMLSMHTPGAMLTRMEIAGTSPAYSGLFNAVRTAQPVDDATLDRVDGQFPESVQPADIVSAMITAEDAMHHLELIAAAEWRVPADHPDLVAAAEAGRLTESLRFLTADVAFDATPVQFNRLAIRSYQHAVDLESALSTSSTDREALDAVLHQLKASCTRCHAIIRD